LIILKEFKTFIAVARLGTFTGAGQQLGLTQSAISAQIRRLEEYLGVVLFDRTARSAVLNPVGQEMLTQAEEIVALVERMVTVAGAGQVTGLLRVGAIANLVRRGLGAALLPQTRQLQTEGLRLQTLEDAAFVRCIGMIGCMPFETNSVVGKFADCLLAAAREPL
jgi:DNA-binding transcriptional LysR family regulator